MNYQRGATMLAEQDRVASEGAQRQRALAIQEAGGPQRYDLAGLRQQVGEDIVFEQTREHPHVRLLYTSDRQHDYPVSGLSDNGVPFAQRGMFFLDFIAAQHVELPDSLVQFPSAAIMEYDYRIRRRNGRFAMIIRASNGMPNGMPITDEQTMHDELEDKWARAYFRTINNHHDVFLTPRTLDEFARFFDELPRQVRRPLIALFADGPENLSLRQAPWALAVYAIYIGMNPASSAYASSLDLESTGEAYRSVRLNIDRINDVVRQSDARMNLRNMVYAPNAYREHVDDDDDDERSSDDDVPEPGVNVNAADMLDQEDDDWLAEN